MPAPLLRVPPCFCLRAPHVVPMSLPPHPLHTHPSTQPRHPALCVRVFSPLILYPCCPASHTDAAPPLLCAAMLIPSLIHLALAPSLHAWLASHLQRSPPCAAMHILSRLHPRMLCALVSVSIRPSRCASCPCTPRPPPCTPVPDSWAVPPCTRLCTGTPVQPCAVRTAAAPPSCALPCLFCSASSGAHLYATACMWARLSRYTSILGILSTILIVVVILVDGNHLGIAFGPFMAGFSGHAVIPSLARDMTNTSEFNMILSCIVATSIYVLIGCAGHPMFGKSVGQEISMEHTALGILVISPRSKFALTTQPLSTAIHILIGIDSPIATPEELEAKLGTAGRGGTALRCCVHPHSRVQCREYAHLAAPSGCIPGVRVPSSRVRLNLPRVVVWGMDWVPRGCTAWLHVDAAHILLSRGARKCEVSAVPHRSFLLAWTGERWTCASAIVQATFIQAQGWGVRGIGIDVCTIVLHLVLCASRFSSLFEPGVNGRRVYDGADMYATFAISMPFWSVDSVLEPGV
ncbi:hypothetical protein B0H14DRAFT_3457996 [Mycena olivaceomarginata]|nr:hypothetical protein B0H14DRAFT_3457996 [Mycena olivaceomarginata]